MFCDFLTNNYKTVTRGGAGCWLGVVLKKKQIYDDPSLFHYDATGGHEEKEGNSST